MQIHTTVRHCDLDPEDRRFAQQRFERLVRFARDIREGHLVVTGEGNRRQVEITLKLTGRDLASHEVAADARAAIVLAFEHLEEQLRRLKERRVSSKRGARGVDGPAPNGSPAGGDDDLGAGLDQADFDRAPEDEGRDGLGR